MLNEKIFNLFYILFAISLISLSFAQILFHWKSASIILDLVLLIGLIIGATHVTILKKRIKEMENIRSN